MVFFLVQLVIAPLSVTQLASLAFSLLFLEHCSVRGFCGSRQARSNGLPGGAVTPFKT
jgi:hypothetical protein